ncbi:MAG TPA: CHAP domain-containing protein, partial [Acidimicrobiia bacterium]|nr:CHAP domain-containing protein [Acidimicrobiia bacterium]
MRSRVLRCAAAVMCAVGVAVSAPAGAATGGYPDAMMPCAQAPYATFGTGAWCRNDDWGPVRDTTPNWSVATTHSVRGYGYRNCTDWVAWRLQSFGVPDALTRGLGNGGQWAANAGRNHLSVSSTPKAGDAAVIAGNPGHVAFVEAVHGDGTITVSEYNAVGDGAFDSWTGAPGARGFSAFVDFGLTLHASAAVPPSVIGAVSDAAGALELYWVGADGVLHERVRAVRGPWSNEVRLPIVARAVAPATNSRGAVQIFSVGGD